MMIVLEKILRAIFKVFSVLFVLYVAAQVLYKLTAKPIEFHSFELKRLKDEQIDITIVLLPNHVDLSDSYQYVHSPFKLSIAGGAHKRITINGELIKELPDCAAYMHNPTLFYPDSDQEIELDRTLFYQSYDRRKESVNLDQKQNDRYHLDSRFQNIDMPWKDLELRFYLEKSGCRENIQGRFYSISLKTEYTSKRPWLEFPIMH